MNHFIRRNGFRPQIDLDYLRKILTEIEPLDLELLKQREQKAYVALANIKTDKTDYLLLNQKLDPIEILMACVAMPTYCPPKELDGQFYYDGGLTSQPPLDFADSLVQDEIWVVLNRPLGYRVTNLGWELMSLAVKDKIAKKLVAEKPGKINKILENIERRKDLIIICPKQKLPVHWLTTGKKDILETIDLGKEAIKEILKKRGII
jgi:predicted patatin/cPLA2 family phospholipase